MFKIKNANQMIGVLINKGGNFSTSIFPAHDHQAF
jgi:hypothetical protein